MNRPILGLKSVVCLVAIFLGMENAFALEATDTIKAASFSGQSGVTTESCSEGGLDVTSIQNGSYLYFNAVNFGSGGIQCFEARIASYGAGGFIEIHLDGLAGTLIGTCEILPRTGGWQTWTTKACSVSGVTGAHTVFLKFTGGTGTLFSLNWFKFHGTPAFISAGWRSSTASAMGKWAGTIAMTTASGSPTVQVFPDTQYQRVDGFGGTFNDNGAHCIDTLNRISPGMGTAIMRELFDPASGARLTIGRVSIGMSDFTVTKNYSLDEIPSGSADTADYQMNYFSTAHDLQYNIPYVKAAMQFQPNLTVCAEPWTPPRWMKSNKSWQGGSGVKINMDTQTLTAYAMYFRKFVQAWKSNGIAVANVFPQHEVDWDVTAQPACGWTGNELSDFIKNYLGPDFAANAIKTEIWIGTAEYSRFTSYVKPALDDASACAYITGVGFDRNGANGLDTALRYKPQLHLHGIQTENMCWSGANTWADAMKTFCYMDSFWNRGTNSYNICHLILDSSSNYVAWMSRSQNAMVVVNPRVMPPTVKFTGEFFVFKHWSYYIAPGAVRIKMASANGNLEGCGFKNPDGSIILELQNNSSSAISPTIQVGSQAFTPTLAASSVNTFILGGTPDPRDWVPGSIPSVPGMPSLTSPTNGATGQRVPVNLAWNGMSGTSSYTVQVSSTIDFSASLVHGNLSSTTYALASLAPNTTYYWRVSGTNFTGTGPWSAAWSFSTMPATPPAAPILGSPSNGSGNQPVSLTFSWTSVNLADSYSFQLATESSYANPVVRDSLQQSCSRILAGLANGTSYYWRVQAKNDYGTSPWASAWFSTAPLLPPTLSSPADNAVNQSITPSLSWGPATGATSFTVQMATSSAFSSLVLNQSGIAANYCSLNSLANSVQYFWRVQSVNSSATSSWSSIWNFYTLIPMPTLSGPADGAIVLSPTPSLSWSPVTGATSYSLQIATSSSFANTVFQQNSLAGVGVSATGLISNQQYYWHVNASNSAESSAWSTTWGFKTAGSAAERGIFALKTDCRITGKAINYTLGSSVSVDLNLYNILGRKAFHSTRRQAAGHYRILMKELNLSPGRYIVDLKAGAFTARKVLIISD